MKTHKYGSNFKKKKHDFYRSTDINIHSSLNNVLDRNVSFVEPCAGYADLINGLQHFGHRCVFASDLKIRRKTPEYVQELNAFDLSEKHVRKASFIITNPPFTRSILHPMIEHFISLRPTWLIFEADWAHTLQSIPFMPYCKTIISIGRIQWFKGTKGKSTKDFSWYFFTDRKSKSINFIPRVPTER